MPIFFERAIAESTRLAIWKIEEREEFFLTAVPVQREITHPHKRLQHLAGRYLLRYLFRDFPTDLIQLADTRKPFLPDEAYHFSISHCSDFAAAIVSKSQRVGIDIETFSDKVQRIRHKFISEREEEIINTQYSISNDQVGIASSSTPHSTYQSINLSTLIWSCKEAIFKWYGLGGLDFRTDMPLHKITALPNNCWETEFCFRKNGDESLHLHSQFFTELCLSYIST